MYSWRNYACMKLKNASLNKLEGEMQSVCVWAHRKSVFILMLDLKLGFRMWPRAAGKRDFDRNLVFLMDAVALVLYTVEMQVHFNKRQKFSPLFEIVKNAVPPVGFPSLYSE